MKTDRIARVDWVLLAGVAVPMIVAMIGSFTARGHLTPGENGVLAGLWPAAGLVAVVAWALVDYRRLKVRSTLIYGGLLGVLVLRLFFLPNPRMHVPRADTWLYLVEQLALGAPVVAAIALAGVYGRASVKGRRRGAGVLRGALVVAPWVLAAAPVPVMWYVVSAEFFRVDGWGRLVWVSLAVMHSTATDFLRVDVVERILWVGFVVTVFAVARTGRARGALLVGGAVVVTSMLYGEAVVFGERAEGWLMDWLGDCARDCLRYGGRASPGWISGWVSVVGLLGTIVIIGRGVSLACTVGEGFGRYVVIGVVADLAWNVTKLGSVGWQVAESPWDVVSVGAALVLLFRGPQLVVTMMEVGLMMNVARRDGGIVVVREGRKGAMRCAGRRQGRRRDCDSGGGAASGLRLGLC